MLNVSALLLDDIYNAHYCVLFSTRVMVRVKTRFSIWLGLGVTYTYFYYLPLSLSHRLLRICPKFL